MKQQIMQTVKGTDVVSKSQQHEHKALKRKGPVPVKKYTSIFFSRRYENENTKGMPK